MKSQDSFIDLVVSTKQKAPIFADDHSAELSESVLVLDAISTLSAEGAPQVSVYFPHYVNYRTLRTEVQFFDDAGQELACAFEKFARGVKAIITLAKPMRSIKMIVGDKTHIIEPHAPSALFQNKNTALLTTNGEAPNLIADWINYYVVNHNLQSVLIFERLSANEAPSMLAQKLKEFDIAADIVVLTTTAALGKFAPNDREVYMAPDAPGKEEMEMPTNDLWHSELVGPIHLEVLRERFLSASRAVLNLQVSDIIPANTQNIFDQTVNSSEGYTQLFGQACYPWRIRKNDIATFGDHCCVSFADDNLSKGWCLVPNGSRSKEPWNLYRVGSIPEDEAQHLRFWRMMAIRHHDPKDNSPNLAPKTALIIHEALHNFVVQYFEAKPVKPPEAKKIDEPKAENAGSTLIVTTMKNEGPFLLEWLAYHRAIGIDKFIVYTNDCSDGTDSFFDLLQKKGIVEHRQNPYLKLDMKPQHAALADAKKVKSFKAADWVICMDVDEYINIHVGDGTLKALFDAVPDANMISMTWRLIGNSNVVEFKDQPIIEQFNQAAHDMTRFPHQAWGIKTLYRQLGLFKKMGVHRPKGLKPEMMDHIKWVNGSGKYLPETFYRTAWRTGTATVGYDMVTLNHYAVRSMESFLVKRDRGRVNHVDRDQGLHYWFRMNHNVIEDNSIKRMIPAMQVELDQLMSDPEIAAQHKACVDAHRAKIDELLTTDAYRDFFALINSERLRELSRHTNKLGMNVYEVGEHVITKDALEALRDNKLNYFNVNSNGQPFTDQK